MIGFTIMYHEPPSRPLFSGACKEPRATDCTGAGESVELRRPVDVLHNSWGRYGDFSQMWPLFGVLMMGPSYLGRQWVDRGREEST